MHKNIHYHSCQGHVQGNNAYHVYKTNQLLNHWVQEFWQLNVPTGAHNYRCVPDNCVDIIFNLATPEEAIVVTPFSSVKIFTMTGPAAYFGIRFNPLGHQGIIPAPLGSWDQANHIINAAELLPEKLLHSFYEGVLKTLSFQSRCKYFTDLLLEDLQHYTLDARLMRYMQYCHQTKDDNIKLSEAQCANFGISSRQLRRLTTQYLGLSPKDFSRVIRFQRTLTMMASTHDASAWAQSYYDQAHFIRDFKSMSGVTPNKFPKLSVLYNTGQR